MEHIANLFGQKIKKTRFANERQEIIQKFVDGINKEREGTKYKPMTWKAVNGKLSHIKNIETLRDFYKDCKKSKNFGAKFFWSLKVDK